SPPTSLPPLALHDALPIYVILTTGGTGFTGRDVTPEAVEPLFDKRMDGFSAIFHRISYDSIGTSTLQSRATAGTIGSTFVFVLRSEEHTSELHSREKLVTR